MFWQFAQWDTRSFSYGPNISIDVTLWDRLPGTLDGTILSIAVQLYKKLEQGTRGSFRTWALGGPYHIPTASLPHPNRIPTTVLPHPYRIPTAVLPHPYRVKRRVFTSKKARSE